MRRAYILIYLLVSRNIIATTFGTYPFALKASFVGCDVEPNAQSTDTVVVVVSYPLSVPTSAAASTTATWHDDNTWPRSLETAQVSPEAKIESRQIEIID